MEIITGLCSYILRSTYTFALESSDAVHKEGERESSCLSTITESFSLMGMKEFHGLEFTLQITSCYEFCSCMNKHSTMF